MSDDFLSYFRTHAIPRIRDISKELAHKGETCWLGVATEVLAEARERGMGSLPIPHRNDLRDRILRTVVKDVTEAQKVRAAVHDRFDAILDKADSLVNDRMMLRTDAKTFALNVLALRHAVREFHEGEKPVTDDVSKAKHQPHRAPEVRREQAAEFWQQGIVLGRQQSQTDAQQQQSQESERNVPRQTQ